MQTAAGHQVPGGRPVDRDAGRDYFKSVIFIICVTPPEFSRAT